MAVDQPLATPDTALPLLPGAYVDVEIEGRPLEDTITIPRTALSQGNLVWVVSADNRLQRREVSIGWRERDAVVVVDGLRPGERVVTSPLASPVEGMAVAPLTARREVGPAMEARGESASGSEQG